jgi:heme exporter protein C
MLLPLLVMAVGFTLYYATVVLMRARCEILESESGSSWVRELAAKREN